MLEYMHSAQVLGIYELYFLTQIKITLVDSTGVKAPVYLPLVTAPPFYWTDLLNFIQFCTQFLWGHRSNGVLSKATPPALCCNLHFTVLKFWPRMHVSACEALPLKLLPLPKFTMRLGNFHTYSLFALAWIRWWVCFHNTEMSKQSKMCKEKTMRTINTEGNSCFSGACVRNNVSEAMVHSPPGYYYCYLGFHSLHGSNNTKHSHKTFIPFRASISCW